MRLRRSSRPASVIFGKRSVEVCVSIILSVGLFCFGGGLFAVPQYLAVDLAGRGFGQLRDELYASRKFVLAQAFTGEVLELLDVLIAPRSRRNHEGLYDLPADLVRHADHGGFLDVRVFEKGALDLDRAHRPAGGNDDVVGTTGEIGRASC